MAIERFAATEYGSLSMTSQKRTNAWYKHHAMPLTMGALAAFSLGVSVVNMATLKPVELVASPIGKLKVIETGFESGRLSMEVEHAQLQATLERPRGSYISIDDTVEYQEILGFGGAFTEAAALQFQRLPLAKQQALLELYFGHQGNNGAAYSFGRVPMNSCDFSPASYSFDEVANDTTLEHFDVGVTHDAVAMIPFIKQALTLRPDLKLFLSPWSPPAWMKYPDRQGKQTMLGSAEPYGLPPEFRETWALYFSKFVSAYKSHGIPFWGVTPQNEPQQPAPWEACLYDDAYQAAFVADFLGPRLRQDHPHLKIMIFDHNRGNVHLWAQGVYNHSTVEPFVDGVAFHWYDNSRDLDGVQNHEHVNQTHNLNPSKFLLATEAAHCPGVANGKEAWHRGLRYAHDIMSDLTHWASGWVDWNLILDDSGGPNKLGNTCDAPIIVHPDGADFTVQPMYYFIKHFSAYVPPGSKRIATKLHVEYSTRGDEVQLVPRFPGGAYPCDGSSRQLFVRTQDNKIQVNATSYCLDVVAEPWLGNRIEMVECAYTTQSWTFGSGKDQTIQFGSQCLSHSLGALENGGRLTIEPCQDGSKHQQWSFQGSRLVIDAHDGIDLVGVGMALRNAGSNACVTAGYAFLQAVTFKTPSDDRVLIVLNENTVDATFKVHTGSAQVDTVVPKQSIRTFVWRNNRI
ncbi:unnamed protein product [Aphanomyces euteiches]